MKPLLYVAGPLFSQAERDFNLALATSLECLCQVFLPQRDGQLFTEVAKTTSVDQARKRVFTVDIAAIDQSSIVLIVLDGRAVDEGASFELGYAYARGKKCIGLQTDVRRLLPHGNNPMVDSALSAVMPSVQALLDWITKDCQRPVD